MSNERDYRKELWIAVAAAYAGSEKCKEHHLPALVADRVLQDFDKRFSAPAGPDEE